MRHFRNRYRRSQLRRKRHVKGHPEVRHRTTGSAREVAIALAGRIDELCKEILPHGVRRGDDWCVGPVNGEPGELFRVRVSGENAGTWVADNATRGDALGLVKAVQKLATAAAIGWARGWLLARENKGYYEAEPQRADKAKADADRAAKEKAEAEEQAIIDALAKKNPIDYDRARRDAADKLGIRRSTLDDRVQARRAEATADASIENTHWQVEPSPQPVDGSALLTALIQRIRRHVAMTAEQAIAVALWIILAWMHATAAVYSPILMVTSAEANSGKTTLLDLLVFLVPRALPCVDLNEATLFRSVDLWSPTLIRGRCVVGRQ